MSNTKVDSYLRKLYTDPKSTVAFSSASRLYRAALKEYPNITLSRVRRYLESEAAYTLHKPTRRNFSRSRVITDGLFEQADMDLADVSNIAAQNKHTNFLMIMIDPFSRYAAVEPLKDKSAPTVLAGLKRLFARYPKLPKSVRHDKGNEFVNSQVREYLKTLHIKQFIARGAPKANYAERFIRTLKTKLYRYMTHNNTKNYAPVLQDIVEGYNNSYHSSIKMKPTQVNEENESRLWKYLYLSSFPTKRKRHRYRIGQQVRVSLRKHPLDKGYTRNWSETVFKIRDTVYRDRLPIYKISDLYDRPYTDSYYEAELQPVRVDISKKKIEKIIQSRRGKGGNTEYHIRWKYYGPSYDQWVSKDILDKYI